MKKIWIILIIIFSVITIILISFAGFLIFKLIMSAYTQMSEKCGKDSIGIIWQEDNTYCKYPINSLSECDSVCLSYNKTNNSPADEPIMETSLGAGKTNYYCYCT